VKWSFVKAMEMGHVKFVPFWSKITLKIDCIHSPAMVLGVGTVQAG